MSKILKFNNFITENEATEMGAFTVTPKTVTLVEGSSEGLRKMKEAGVITTINIVAPRPGRKETDKLNGISFAVKVNKIEDIIIKLSEQRYNISPDLFKILPVPTSSLTLSVIVFQSPQLKSVTHDINPVLFHQNTKIFSSRNHQYYSIF
jgi:hypothetical protein